jgi:WD40 repeat protein
MEKQCNLMSVKSNNYPHKIMKIYNEKILIVIENESKKIHIYNLKNNLLIKVKKLKGHTNPIISSEILNSTTLVSADLKRIKIWNLKTKRIIKNIFSCQIIKFIKKISSGIFLYVQKNNTIIILNKTYNEKI